MKKQLTTIIAAIVAIVAVRNVNANPYAYGHYYNTVPQVAVTNAYNAQVNAYNAYTNAYTNAYANAYATPYANAYTNAYTNTYNNVYNNCQPYGTCYTPQYRYDYNRHCYDRPDIKINIKNKTVYNNITQNNIYKRRDRFDNGWNAPWRPRYNYRDVRKRTKETHEYREKHTYETDTRKRGYRRNYRFDW